MPSTGKKGGGADKRSGDPEEGGLTTGEKSAITRAMHEGRDIKFLADHPEKQAAVDKYKEEVMAKEAGSPKSPKSPKGKKK